MNYYHYSTIAAHLRKACRTACRDPAKFEDAIYDWSANHSGTSDLGRLVRSFSLAILNWDPASVDDLREEGWYVAIHNDYQLNDKRYTFWLFTHPDGRCVQGKGSTDAEALEKVRAALDKTQHQS